MNTQTQKEKTLEKKHKTQEFCDCFLTETYRVNNQYSLGVLKLHLLAKRNPMVASMFVSGILTAEQIYLHQHFVSACLLTSDLIVILQYINDPNH